MSFNAGSAYISLEGKDKGALKMLDQVEKKTGKIHKGLSGLTKAFIALGGALVIKDIITTYGQFEQAVANAASVTGAFGKQLDKTKANITAVSKELGKTTVFSANEAATALYDLASAGEDVANVTAMDIKPILDLAAATGTTLPQAMEQSLAAMNQMGLEMEDMGAITDSLMATIASSPANMERLQGAWKAAAPVANSLGVDFNELNAALGTLFSKGFLQGEQAGTALRNMMIRLVPTTKAQVESLATLGLSAKDVSIEENGLLGVLQKLKTSFSGLESDTARVAAAKKLFGEEAAGAAVSLIMEADATKKLYDSMELMKQKAEETGTTLTAMVADMQLDTMQGSLKLFTSNLESLKIAIGETLAPMIRTVAELLGSIAASEGIQKIFQAFFVILRDVILGIINVFTEWKKVIGETFGGDSAKLLKSFTRGFEILGNAIKLVLGIIKDFGVFVIKTVKKVSDFINDKWGGEILEIFRNFITFIKGVFGVFAIIVQTAFNKVVEIFNKILPYFIEIFDGVIKIVNGFFQIFTGNFAEGFSNIWDGIVSFASGTIKIIGEALMQVGGFFVKLSGFIGRTFLKLVVGLGVLWLDLVTSIARVFIGIIKNAGIFVKNLFKSLTNIDWGKVWSGMQEWFGKALSNIIAKAKSIGKSIADFFKNIFGGDDGTIDVKAELGTLSSGEKKKMLSEYESVYDGIDFSRTKKVFSEIGEDFSDTFLDVDTSKIDSAALEVKRKLSESAKLTNGNTLSEQEDIIGTLNTQNKLTEELEKNNIANNEAVKSGGAASKEKNKAEEEANKKSLTAYQEIGGKIKDSIVRIQKYGDTLSKLQEQFSELKKSAQSDLYEINNSLAEMETSLLKIKDAGIVEREGLETGSDTELAERRVDILSKQAEIEKEIKDLQEGDDEDKTEKINTLKLEQKNLLEELSLITENVSEEMLKQVEAASKLNESQRILAQLKSDLAEQKIEETTALKEIEEEKKLLLEKKAISQAILDDRNIKIIEEGELLKAFYIDAEGKEVEIKDFKNIQYAQDLENKRLVIQSQLLAVEEGMLKEKDLLSGFYEDKKIMEQEFGVLFAEEKEKQRKIIEAEMEQTRQAIKVWQEYWKAKRSGGGDANIGYEEGGEVTGFANGGYTGDIGNKKVAGVVHGGEYVIPAKVMKKIAGTGLLDGLESMRKGFFNGGFTSPVSNSKSSNMNVTQNINNGVDMGAAIREMGYMLRLNT